MRGINEKLGQVAQGKVTENEIVVKYVFVESWVLWRVNWRVPENKILILSAVYP